MKLAKEYEDFPEYKKLMGAELDELKGTAARLEMLPCPFCGGDAVVTIGLVYDDSFLISVNCGTCHCGTPRKPTGIMVTGKNYSCKDRLIEAAVLWNRRTGTGTGTESREEPESERCG